MQRSLSIPPHCLHAQPITREAMKQGPGVGHCKKNAGHCQKSDLLRSWVWCSELRCSSAQRGHDKDVSPWASDAQGVPDRHLAALEPWHWPRCCCRAVSTLLAGSFLVSLFPPCAVAALYLHVLPTENQIRHGEREGRIWSRNSPVFLRAAHEGSLVLALCLPISWPWPGVLFSCNPLSFLNLLDESSSHFCLPCEKRASVSLLRWKAVSTEKSAVWWICLPEYWLIYIPGIKTWNLYHVYTLIAWKQFRLTERPDSFCNKCEL